MIRYALLGLLQGLTEFLPVSSSGHLVLARAALGMAVPGAALEAAAHLGTLLALLLYFRRDLAHLAHIRRRGEERRYVGLLALGTVPVAVVGFFARNAIERAFGSPSLVGWMLLVTAVVLVVGDRQARRALRDRVRVMDALAVGLAQAAALLPGISRSGSTVAKGIALGLRPSTAARFSLLLAIPAIAGASAFALAQAAGRPGVEWAGLATAMGCAFVSGLAAISLFLRIVRVGVLWPFALYCTALGITVLVLG
ncbi:MAG: undecaprenyl-diphosphate phosphatase [Candidatus Bipolaricaulota bacterium]